jgi:hypothetical protein
LLPFEDESQMVATLLPLDPDGPGGVVTLLEFDENQQADDEIAATLLPFEPEQSTGDEADGVVMLLPLDSGPVAVLLQFEEDDDADDEPVRVTLLPFVDE